MTAALAPAGAAAVLLLGAAGCAGPPLIEGGQIPHPPPGFAYDPNCSVARKALPGREVIRQRCWLTPREPVNAIDVTEFAGPTTAAEAKSARDALAAKWSYLEYGPLESLTIDDRSAWGWLETQRFRGALASRDYKALVSYPDRTFAVEYHHSREPILEAADLRAMVTTFEVRHGGAIDPLRIALLAALGAAAVGVLRKVARWRAEGEKA